MVEEFRDHHLAVGTLMLDWAAAWRTWCRNRVKYGQSDGQRFLPLLAIMQGPDPADPYGAKAWAAKLADARPAQLDDGTVGMAICGYDVAGVAFDVCEAAGLQPSWRGDLMHVAWWLRDGIKPDHIVAVIRASPRPKKPGEWWWYDERVRGVQVTKWGRSG